jgi:hypothetical protein
MADHKVQLLNKGGSSLAPATKLAYVGLVSSGGIKITGNTITTSAIPQANISGLTAALNGKQATLKNGWGMTVNGATVSINRYYNIQSDITAGSVTLSAGCAYHIYANGAVVTLVDETYENQHPDQFGLEGHAMIYLTNSAYLKTTSNVVIGTPLTPNMYNNCTLRFHDGHCIIDVEDTKAPA